MSQLGSLADGPQKDLGDIRRRRLLFRCWHRGTQEGDLILGLFAETSLTTLGSTQLDQLEALLDCTDAELFDWVIGARALPKEYDHEVMCLLRAFWTQRRRLLQHNEHART